MSFARRLQAGAQCARKFAARIRHNADGIAAVEFGFIAPIMLLMLIGTIEVSRAITIDRRFGMVTSMVADLVTREKTMTAAMLEGQSNDPDDGIYGIVRLVMGGYDNGTLKISVIPVKADPDDATNTVVYAATTNRPALNGGVEDPAACADYALAANLVSAGASVIVVRATYTYYPIFFSYVTDAMSWSGASNGGWSWSDTATLSPRNSCVDFDDDNCVSTCF